MCAGMRGRGSQATESSTGIPKIKLKLKRYGKRAEVDGKKERLSGGLFLSLFPSHWPQLLVAQRGLCRGYRPKMKVSLLQHAHARYLSQESGSQIILSGDRFRKAFKSAVDARPKRRKKVRF